MGKWADPCGTAIQGQLMIEPEQAPDIPSPFKNQNNIEGATTSLTSTKHVVRNQSFIEFEIKFFVWKKIEQDFSIFNKNWKLSFLFPRVYSFWFSIDPKDIVSAIFPLIDKRICWASWNFFEPARDANPVRIFLAIIYDTLTG